MPALASILAVTQHVHCDNCGGTSVWDVLGAVSGFVGGLAALYALKLARSSARDAENAALRGLNTWHAASDTADAARDTAEAAQRTAVAAEEELKLAKEEAEAARAERNRRADVEATLLPQRVAMRTEGTHSAVIALRLVNSGSRTAERIVVNLWLPAGVGVDNLQVPAWLLDSRVEEVGEPLAGGGLVAKTRWEAILGPFDLGVRYDLKLQLSNLRVGMFPVVVVVRFNEADVIRRNLTFMLSAGGGVSIEPVNNRSAMA